MNFSRKTNQFFGNYRATVVENNDTTKKGRIQVRVLGLFQGVDDAHLPWAVPAYPMFSGSGVGHGWFAIPEKSSNVWVFFEEGDFNQPVYFAEASDGVRGHPTVGDTSYPNRRGFVSKDGHYLYFDDTTNQIEISLATGKKITIASSGEITIVDNVTATVVRANSKFNNNGSDGVSGSFQSKDSKTVTVSGGIVTGIV
jgi:uncharacterized protein involved in type VI secretion and phage assembly